MQKNTAKKARKKPNTYSGTVEVCAHHVSFWYDLEEETLTDELREHLDEEAESRAKQSIIEGYVSGELNCLHLFDDDRQEEIRGAWEIDRA